jgi:myo-inositol-1(or 4)-monophosphatase
MADDTYREELKVAEAAARSAGDEVARMREAGIRYGHKRGRELVSEADLHAAKMLHEAISAKFPGDGWLSEEHPDSTERLGKERVWIVDPIDGTREYLQGLPEYAVSVALAVEGKAVVGAVYNPATDEMFTAACAAPEEAVMERPAESFVALIGHGEDRWDDFPPLPAGGRARPIGSVAYRLALLSEKRGDVALTWYARSEWDVAAGAVLCGAAGLRVTDILGDPLPFNQPEPTVKGLLVAAPGLHRRMRTHLTLLS